MSTQVFVTVQMASESGILHLGLLDFCTSSIIRY